MRTFYVADLNARGELVGVEEYRYEALEQLGGAAELIVTFATLVWRCPQEFEETLPDRPSVSVRWRSSSPSSGLFTIRCGGELASLSLLASGKNAEADRITLEAFQRHLLRGLHGTSTEPSFVLLDLKHRPMVATISFISPRTLEDQLAVAISDRCFAAAYFRSQDLA